MVEEVCEGVLHVGVAECGWVGHCKERVSDCLGVHLCPSTPKPVASISKEEMLVVA